MELTSISPSDLELTSTIENTPELTEEKWLDRKKTVKKYILQKGTGLICPRDGSVCKVFAEDIYGFSRYAEELFAEISAPRLIVGNCDTCVGRVVEKILLTMKPGEVALIRCKLKMEEIREDIARDFSVISSEHGEVLCDFKLHLISFQEQPDIHMLEDPEKFEKALIHKERGVTLFNNGQHRSAFYRFSKALKWLIFVRNPRHPDFVVRYLDCMRRCYLNIAACQLDTGYSEFAIKNCNRALKLDALSLKGYYRRGVAYMNIQEYEKAINDFKTILSIAPENSTAQVQLEKAKAKLSDVDNFYKRQLKKMFRT